MPSFKSASITRMGATYSIMHGGPYGCSDELSHDCEEGPFEVLFTAEMNGSEAAMCGPCAKLLGWPVDDLRKKYLDKHHPGYAEQELHDDESKINALFARYGREPLSENEHQWTAITRALACVADAVNEIEALKEAIQ